MTIEDERRTFAVGENLSITCITIPPNISVIWEVSNGSEFVEVADPQVLTQTTLQLTNLSLNDANRSYRCRGTGGLANETAMATRFFTVLPGKLYGYVLML